MTWCADDRAFNFAIYSKHATAVRLLLFADDELEVPRTELALDPLRHKSGRIWHCRLPAAEVERCRYYGYRVDGPQPVPPFEVHAFDPEKLLLDPYAREVVFPPGFARAAAIASGRTRCMHAAAAALRGRGATWAAAGGPRGAAGTAPRGHVHAPWAAGK